MSLVNSQAAHLRKSDITKPPLLLQVHRKVEKDAKEDLVREVYGLENTDPNVTFALCCGTRSSPAVSRRPHMHMRLRRHKFSKFQRTLKGTSSQNSNEP